MSPISFGTIIGLIRLIPLLLVQVKAAQGKDGIITYSEWVSIAMGFGFAILDLLGYKVPLPAGLDLQDAMSAKERLTGEQ